MMAEYIVQEHPDYPYEDPKPQELIRCKDCKYYHPSYCEIWSKFGTIQTRPKGYCYMAERRNDLISRAEAINEIKGLVATMSVCLSREECNGMRSMKERAINAVKNLSNAVIMCRDCKYGKQDDEGRWYCGEIGCSMGSDDGSGFCSDAERRNDE